MTPLGCDETTEPTTAPPPVPAGRPAAAAESSRLRDDLVPFFRLIEARQTGPARVRLRKRLDRDQTDGQACFLFALSYHRERRYGLARPYFERALAHEPSFAPAWYFSGWASYYLGDIEAARVAFERHLLLTPDAGDSHFGLGLIALDEDRLDDAADRFETALEIHGDTPGRDKDRSKAHARLADVFVRRGHFEDAKAELETATTLFPDHYEAYYKLYRVHMRLEETEAADAALAKFHAARERVRPGTRFPE
ncbi:MAG: tetratricopeptide repeat protein [Phycisphaerales bacterium]|nr:tetratricopeptide repeat protein [Phycisphaerae bacterium]NNM27586.1 tetratricopeptide repeat protein [Phycisphaerales bacterium]